MAAQPIDFSDLGGRRVSSASGAAVSPSDAPVSSSGIDFSDLGGKMVQAAPAAEQVQADPGVVRQVWNWLNKGLIKPDDIVDMVAGHPGASDELKQYVNRPPSKDVTHNVLYGIKKGLAGAALDTANVASGFTSPLGIGTLGAGAATKIPGAAGAVAKAVTGVSSVGFGAAGAADIAAAGTENTPEAWQQRLTGGAMLAGGAAGAAGTVRSIGRVAAPLGETVTKARGTIPPEQYSPAELKAYADQNGIPVNAAQLTEHNLPRNLQSAAERASIGGTGVRQQIRASQAGVAEHAESLMDAFSPNTPDLATAGSVIKQNVETALEREQVSSRQQYAAIDQQAGGVSVDLRPLKQTAQTILADSNFVRKVGALDPKRASAILQDIANLPDRGTFSQAQDLRSALLDASRTPELAISNQAQAWIKQLTGTVDNGMMTAAKSKPGLEPAFRAANAHWTDLQDDFNNPRSPLAQILQEPDPSKVPQKLTQRGQIGGSPYNAQLLDQYGIDKGPVKRVIVEDLLGKNFGLWHKTLGGYSDDFLQSVFSPDELDAVYKTGAIARSVGLNTNPSGTAAVMGAMQDVRHPIVTALPKALAAGATKSPAFNRWMLRAPGQQGRGYVPLSMLLGGAASTRSGQE